MAKCPSRPNGNRWVYYPSDMADPTDAEYVKENGREREPVDPRNVSPTIGQTAMTDGGVPREADANSTDWSDAKWQDLDWVGDGAEDDGNDDPESSGSRNHSETPHRRRDRCPSGRQRPDEHTISEPWQGERHPYGDKRRQDNDR